MARNQEIERINGMHLPDDNDSEVLRLTWAVIDDVASESDLQRLKELVSGQYGARREYFSAIRLESELIDLLQPADSQPLAPCERAAPELGLPVVVPKVENLATTG